MSRSLLLLCLVTLSSACATVGGRAASPLAKEVGKPAPVVALGKQYTVPADLTVPDQAEGPGWKVLDFTDQVTACDGAVFFTTVSSATKHQDLVQRLVKEKRATYEPRVKVVEHQGTPAKLLGADGRLTVLDLSTADDKAALALLDQHLPSQNLSLVGVAFCSDPGLMKAEVDRLTELFTSQQVPSGAPGTRVASQTQAP